MSRFSDEKHKQFDAELGELVQRYLDMPDVDALELHLPLARRAEQMRFIAVYERNKFREEERQKRSKAP